MAAGAALLAAALLAGCVTTPETPYQPDAALQQPTNLGAPVFNSGAPQMPPTNTVSPLLRVGDLVMIDFFDIPSPGIQQFKDKVRDDGNLVLPFNITVHAAGRTTSQLQDDIRTAYVPALFTHLTVSVKIDERFYFVGGEVKVPNRQLYLGDMTVLRAIDTAGGFTDFAKRTSIELRRANGQSFKIDWKKAMKDSKLDLQVYPNDQIIVHKRTW